jgi:hypothetical protein
MRSCTDQLPKCGTRSFQANQLEGSFVLRPLLNIRFLVYPSDDVSYEMHRERISHPTLHALPQVLHTQQEDLLWLSRGVSPQDLVNWIHLWLLKSGNS